MMVIPESFSLAFSNEVIETILMAFSKNISQVHSGMLVSENTCFKF